MKIFSLLLGLLLITTVGLAQDPVHWSFSTEKVNDAEYNIVATAKIDDGWSVYSQYLESDDGPIATSFDFSTDNLELIGKTEETGNRKESYDDLFGMNLVKFSKTAIFTQTVKSTDGKTVRGTVTFMTCTETSCLPPKDVAFEVNLEK